MKLRKLMSLVLAAAMLLGVTGCFEKPMDAVTLMEKMIEATGAVTAAAQTAEVEMEMELSMSGITVEMGMDMEMETAFTDEPFNGYYKMDMTMDAMGQSQDITVEMYYAMEEDVLVAYTYDGSTDSWSRQEIAEMPDMSQLEELAMDVDTLDPETLTLAEETQLIGETEVYVLSGTITGQQIQDAFSAMMDTMTAEMDEETSAIVEDLDMTAMNVPFVYYINTETFLPVKMELQMQGLGEVMQSMMDTLMAEAMGVMGEGYEVEMTVEIPDFTVVMDNMTYENVEVPAVPQEGIEAAALNPDRGDGSYVLCCGGEALRILPPEGYEMYYVDSEYLSLSNTLTYDYLDYSFSAETTPETIQTNMDAQVAWYQQSELYEEHGMGEPIGDYSTMWLKCSDGFSLYYAWKQVGEGYMYIYAEDTTGKDMVEVLTPVLEAIESYEG